MKELLCGTLIGFVLLCAALVGSLIRYVDHLNRLLP